MSKMKIVGIISLILVLLTGLVINVWYLYVKLYAGDTIVVRTFNVGLQTLEDGTTKPLAEIQLFNNAYEFKWNYVMDENRTDFYSQGVQIIGDDINWSYNYDPTTKNVYDSTGMWWWKEEYHQYFGRFVNNNESYSYASYNDYEDTVNSTNPISDETLFKLTLHENGEDEIYGMKFKGSDTPSNDSSLYERAVRSQGGVFNQIDIYTSYYFYYDFNYFLSLMYNSIQSLSHGVRHNIVFEFGDLFNYYAYDDDTGKYATDPVSIDQASLITESVKSYWTISVTIHDKALEKASESLFNCFAGSPNYNSGDISSDDYFIGRTVIDLQLSDFILVNIDENSIALRLRDEIIEYYSQDQYKGKIYLSVLIDLDKLESLGYDFVGFTGDHGLDNFTVISCRSVQTIDGELVYSEVPYDI